jgi:hypothetical protein
MAIQKYNGELGKFEYDDTQFEICNGVVNGDIYLHYIGKETDGSKITIPYGIEDANKMFKDTAIKTAPTIPDSVKVCNEMFCGCNKLVEASEIPTNVRSCYHMFYGCKSLKEPPYIHDGPEDCRGMFQNCSHLEVGAELPNTATKVSMVFCGCGSMKSAPDMPNIMRIKSMDSAFMGCKSLERAFIPDGVEDCSFMFNGCTSLKEAPAVPSSVIKTSYMFDRCTDEIQGQGKWNIEHRNRRASQDEPKALRDARQAMIMKKQQDKMQRYVYAEGKTCNGHDLAFAFDMYHDNVVRFRKGRLFQERRDMNDKGNYFARIMQVTNGDPYARDSLIVMFHDDMPSTPLYAEHFGLCDGTLKKHLYDQNGSFTNLGNDMMLDFLNGDFKKNVPEVVKYKDKLMKNPKLNERRLPDYPKENEGNDKQYGE